jgi:hypothetical protein
MSQPEQYDVVILGSGAPGKLLSWSLPMNDCQRQELGPFDLQEAIDPELGRIGQSRSGTET